jgi:hypothetical protein
MCSDVRGLAGKYAGINFIDFESFTFALRRLQNLISYIDLVANMSAWPAEPSHHGCRR